jgi:hypothetical protein
MNMVRHATGLSGGGCLLQTTWRDAAQPASNEPRAHCWRQHDTDNRATFPFSGLLGGVMAPGVGVSRSHKDGVAGLSDGVNGRIMLRRPGCGAHGHDVTVGNSWPASSPPYKTTLLAAPAATFNMINNGCIPELLCWVYRNLCGALI